MQTRRYASPVSGSDIEVGDIRARFDDIERQLVSVLAALSVLRSQLSSGLPDARQFHCQEQRPCGFGCPGGLVDVPMAGGKASGSLTGREREVLALIADGRSNRQIAEILFLSPRTVERHIANIYLKLDVHTKAEATAWVLLQEFTGDA